MCFLARIGHDDISEKFSARKFRVERLEIEVAKTAPCSIININTISNIKIMLAMLSKLIKGHYGPPFAIFLLTSKRSEPSRDLTGFTGTFRT